MKNSWLAVLFLILPLVASCTEHRIDTSSDENMKTSVAKVRDALPSDQRTAFDDAIKTLVANSIDVKHIFASALAGETAQDLAIDDFQQRMKSEISGKTGPEVIAYADEVRLKREAQAKTQALEEIDELQAKRRTAEEAKKDLANFIVLRSRFYKEPKRYSSDQPIIEMTVRNDTSHPISRAYFRGILASPDRAVPWLQETFNYKISGGLEPGEEATWSLAPNQFGEWGKVKSPADAVLTVTVTRLDGADEKALFSTDSFSERDEERLDQLLKRYGKSSQ
ncbi:DUF6694 family lipoprotein [Castellaniella defragrans]|uniref:DUF6694 family lipoprotein n=1 Tax=Castellaniella defragrans TaxID=75697 RepID=UPI0009FCF731|nr:DUF6694 family lipoprotein [Castellaniella defragrans]